jgi:DNA-binding NtrC family response regulator
MSSKPYPEHPILIVDDEESVIESHTTILKSNGLTNIAGCRDSTEVLDLVRDTEFEMILLDLTMPHKSGEQLLREIADGYPHIPVIVVTGTNEVEAAVECMKAGACDYMVKAVEENRLVSGVARAIEIKQLKREYSDLRSRFLADELRYPEAFSPIVTRNRQMKQIFLFIESVADTNQPVLILGETAVGKELIARAVHEASSRTGSFEAVNVAGLDDHMFSDTLFGHLKGAFTGALENRDGLIQRAKGGTLFLDEIGDLSEASQIKLLRLLSTREYRPLGSDLSKRTDARIVLATNRDLDALMAEERFRRDLYYRLSTHEIHVPPLRERKEDLPLLLDHFLEEAAGDLSRAKPFIPAQLITLLNSYHFPGHILELRNMVYDALAKTNRSSSRLSMQPFKDLIYRSNRKVPAEEVESLLLFTDRFPTLIQARELLIAEAMRRAGGNQSIAAGFLGISHQALNKYLKKKQADQAAGQAPGG